MTAAVVLAVACAGGGVWLLYRSWARRGGGWRLALGWLLLAAGVPAWRLAGADWDKATAFAALAGSLAALPVLVWRADWRPGRVRAQRAAEENPQPAPGPQSNALWRGLARAALVGPVAGAAAVGLATAEALRAPLGEADRLVAAGFLLPIAWAVGGVWATTDARLLRIALGLGGLAAAGFGLAVL